jgi:hypothetical protein
LIEQKILLGHSGAAAGGTRNPDGLATCTAWIPGSREVRAPE